MSRRRPSGSHRASGSGTASAQKPESPFKALAGLRGKTAQYSKPAAAPAPLSPTPSAPPVSADDLALFQQSLQGARPLKSSGRAEIERPRPLPQRRLSTPDESARVTTSPARTTPPLLDAYAGVTPLRETGRVSLLIPQRYRQSGLPSSPVNTTGSQPPLPLPEEATADPATLFQYAVQGAQPLTQSNRVELTPASPPPPRPLQHEADERAALDESLHAPLTFEDRLIIGEEVVFIRTGLPRRVINDLRRGRWVLQGEIDLHGLNREEARTALSRFLSFSLQHGRRCIRVIHGKGLGSPGRFSILKHLSRNWLAQREEILAFCQAGPYDGGEGALLVLLRAPISRAPTPRSSL